MKNFIFILIFIYSLYAQIPFTKASYQNGYFYLSKKDNILKRDISKKILSVKLKNLKNIFIRDIKAKKENIFLTGDRNGILFFIKMDKNLNTLFSKELTKDGISFAFSLDTDNNNSFYLTGGTTADLVSSNFGETDIFIMKLDSNADELWIKQFGGEKDEWGKKICYKNNHLYIAAETEESLNEENFKGIRDIAFIKTDLEGDIIFTKLFGTKQEDIVKDIKIDKEGYIYILGETWGKFPNAKNHGFSDLFLTKFDNLGNQLWTKEYGSATADSALNMIITNNHIYIALQSSISFDYALSDSKSFLIKCDLNGNKIWTQAFDINNLIKVASDNDTLFLIGEKISKEDIKLLDKRAFITRLYNVLYQREPKNHEIDFWENKIKDIKSTRVSTKYFFNSKEFSKLYEELSKLDFIKWTYRALLNREPDKKGLIYWQNYQKNKIVNGVIYSKEFLKKYKHFNDSF